jgi:hypothetical protein
MQFFKKIFRQNSREQLRSLAVLCGCLAVLVGAAVLVSAGSGVQKTLTLKNISPASQTACFFGIWGSGCGDPTFTYTNGWVTLSNYAPALGSYIIMYGNGTYAKYIGCGETWMWGGAYGAGPGQLGTGGDPYNYVCTDSYYDDNEYDDTYGTYVCDAGYYSTTYGATSLGWTLYPGNPWYPSQFTVGPLSQPGTYSFQMWCYVPSVSNYEPEPTVTATVAALPLPTLTISADSQNITLGQSTGIHATFAPGSGDTLQDTALNEVPAGGSEYTIPGYGYTPVSGYTYTFIPSVVGSYVFKPYVITSAYPSWSTEGQSVTVNVTAAPTCPNGSGTAGSCTACNSGYTLSGGSCYATCPNGSGPSGSCTSCNSGYTLSGGSCVVVASCTFNGNTIPSGNSVTAYQSSSVTAPATCASVSQIRTCTNGTLSGSYTYSSCTVSIPSGTISSALTATPSRVHSGNSTTLTWSTTNMASCAVTSSDTPPQTLSTALSSAGLTTPAITRVEVYTLSCLDNNSTPFVSQVQVKLVPVTQEI